MGKGSGLGGLLAILGLALVFGAGRRKLTASSFNGGVPITYREYFVYATKPVEEVDPEAGEDLVSMPHPQLDRPPGQWLTINGRIPTPRGTTIPLPSRREGRVAVEEMLQPLETKEAETFQDVAGRKSVNLRLKPL